jgi:pimeloyl-ACP methyl ester carboxylesterase
MSWLLTFVVACAAGYAWLWWRSRFAWVPPLPRARETREAGILETVIFPALDGTLLEGWLIRPHSAHAPLVVMAPGLTGTKEGLLEPFAWRFAEAGIATLLFDYRCFGGSGGMPRHWVDLSRHRQDYEAALRYARDELSARGVIDRARIALWGSSFSGGTALVTAAGDGDVRAVIAQGPYLETTPELQPKGRNMVRYMFWCALDLLPFLPPVYIPVFGRPGEWVFAPSRENPSVRGFDPTQGARFWSALPKTYRGGWENRMLARMLANFDDVVPMNAIDALNVPLLLVAAEDDDLIPIDLVKRAHDRAPAQVKQLVVLPCGHFDLYIGPESERNREIQAAFLAQQLGVSAFNPSTAAASRERIQAAL